MARFRYKGIVAFQGVHPRAVRVSLSTGVVELRGQGLTFRPGEELDIDVVEERALRVMRVDPRFEEVE